MVRFFTFSQFHNRRPVAGSTHIRVDQLIKYWPEAGLYKYGENPDVLIFQKVYVSQDYQFPLHFEGKKILDICDPDWLNGVTPIKETINAVDAVTCSSSELARYLGQMTDKPVVVIPDRFDVELLPPPKQHKDDAQTVVWFGYRHNIETIKPAMGVIDRLGLNLLVISDDDPLPWQWLTAQSGDDFRRNKYKFVRYNEETIYTDLQEADFAVLPKGSRPIDPYKSDNKTIKANLAGLPVATNAEEMEYYIQAENRQAFVDKSLQSIRSSYDVRNSVKEYKELIERL